MLFKSQYPAIIILILPHLSLNEKPVRATAQFPWLQWLSVIQVWISDVKHSILLLLFSDKG